MNFHGDRNVKSHFSMQPARSHFLTEPVSRHSVKLQFALSRPIKVKYKPHRFDDISARPAGVALGHARRGDRVRPETTRSANALSGRKPFVSPTLHGSSFSGFLSNRGVR
jgi:hypothetical protein